MILVIQYIQQCIIYSIFNIQLHWISSILCSYVKLLFNSSISYTLFCVFSISEINFIDYESFMIKAITYSILIDSTLDSINSYILFYLIGNNYSLPNDIHLSSSNFNNLINSKHLIKLVALIGTSIFYQLIKFNNFL